MKQSRKYSRSIAAFISSIFFLIVCQFTLRAQDCQRSSLDDINRRGTGIPEATIPFYESCTDKIKTDYYNGRKRIIDNNIAFSQEEKNIKKEILTLRKDSMENDKNLSLPKYHDKIDSIKSIKGKNNKLLAEQYKLLDIILNTYKSTLLKSLKNLIEYYDLNINKTKEDHYKKELAQLTQQ